MRGASVFTHTQNGNAKSAASDEKRLVLSLNQFLAKATGEKFNHSAFVAMGSEHHEIKGGDELVIKHIAYFAGLGTRHHMIKTMRQQVRCGFGEYFQMSIGTIGAMQQRDVHLSVAI